MPKAKTKSGAKKRFKVSKGGQIKHRQAFRSHLLSKKATARKKRLSSMGVVDASDLCRVKKMLTL